eukprot:jgi/Tetstr1/442652/TSEL_030746.t1
MSDQAPGGFRPAPNPAMSPGIAKLDRVLDLVTEHDANSRGQELRMREVLKRLEALEERLDAQQLRQAVPAWVREVDVRAELDSARLAMDRLHKHLAKNTRLHEEGQEELRACRERIAKQNEVDELARSSSRLGKDLGAAQRQVEETQDTAAHLAEGMQEVTACLKELRTLQKGTPGVEDVRSAARDAAAAATRQLEEDISELKEKQLGLVHSLRKMAAAVTKSPTPDTQRQVDELTERIADIAAEQDKTKRRLAKYHQDIQALCKESDVRPAIESLQAGLSGLSNNVAALQGKTQSQTAETSGMVFSLAETVSKLSSELEGVSRQAQAAERTKREFETLQEAVDAQGDDLCSLAESVTAAVRSQAVCCSGALEGARAAALSPAGGSPSASSHPHLYPPPFPPSGAWTAGPALGPLGWRSLYPVQGAGLVAVNAAASEQYQQLFSGLAELQSVSARIRSRRAADCSPSPGARSRRRGCSRSPVPA